MAFIFNLNDTHCQVLWICYVKPYQVLLNTAVSTSDFGLVFPGVCSVFGNSTLLYISYKKKHLLKPAEYFIINLAVSDLGLTVSLYPMAITSSFYHRYTSEVIAPPNQSKMANTKVAILNTGWWDSSTCAIGEMACRLLFIFHSPLSCMIACTYSICSCLFSPLLSLLWSNFYLFCTVLYLFLTHPLRPPTQVAVWENHVFHLRLLRDVVWHLQPDHSHPAKHGLLCESMLSVLW